MTIHLGPDPYVSCDGCTCVASPGPIARGGHKADWMVLGGLPPGWVIKAGKHLCVRCIRKGKAK